MEWHLKIIGVLLIVLACVHAIFPRRFEWKAQLENLSLINRQLMYVHTFFIALVVFLMGLLCLCAARELMVTALGKKILAGLTIFWSLRLAFQFFVYSSLLWRGKRTETIIHILSSFLWTYVSCVFFLAWYYNSA